jgi:hypothetical protein
MFEEKVAISVEVLETAELQIATKTTVIKDGKTVSSATHYDVVPPGGDVSMWPVQIQKVAQATWTPENIAPVTAKVQEAIAVQQAAITEAAAKKLEAEAAANKEIEDAKAREVAANEAKALAEAAEAAAKEAQAKADAAKAASDAALKAAQDAAASLVAQEKVAAEKEAFDKAVVDAVAKLAPVEAVA